MKWGFPFGPSPSSPSSSSATASICINTRDDSLIGTGKPTFRESRSKHRCIVLISGFFEWQHDGKTKIPFFISSNQGGLLFLAGLFTTRRGELACTIVTRSSIGSEISSIHDRMPVFVNDEQCRDLWMGKSVWTEDVEKILHLLPLSSYLSLQRVSNHVNRVQNNDERCIQPQFSDEETASNTKPRQKKITSFFPYLSRRKHNKDA